MPARGKSFISAKLSALLSWSGYKTAIFNAGQERRHTATQSAASFFDPSSMTCKARRETIAMRVLQRCFDFFDEGGDIALFDATNSTKERRRRVVELTQERSAARGSPINIVFIESLCDDRHVLEANMLTKVRNSPDFAGMSEREALDDLGQRIANYQSVYETVEDEEGAYIKLFNFSSKVTANQCYGRMTKCIIPFCMAIHTKTMPVYIAALAPRRREPEYVSSEEDGEPVVGRSKGGAGARPAQHLVVAHQGAEDDSRHRHDKSLGIGIAEWWARQRAAAPETCGRLQIFASTKPTAIEASLEIQRRCEPGTVIVAYTSALNPMVVCEDDFDGSGAACGAAMAQRRSFHDRGPGGESHHDLIKRLEPCVVDVEASVDPCLILTHATPARALRAYFRNLDVQDAVSASPRADEASSALSGMSSAFVEINANVGGGWSEKVHTF